ncbi:MAG: hypothetical protein Q8829_02780, partial [Candidatus Phytoplasma australasiaticum]|nr:hypothetical protein [Candidatus Phytoplasma australasiaticum]
FKNNAKSAFFSIAIMELYKLMKCLGFSLETILSVAGLGDLIDGQKTTNMDIKLAMTK